MTAKRWASWGQALAAIERQWERLGRPPVPSYEIDYDSRMVAVAPSSGRACWGWASFGWLRRLPFVAISTQYLSESPERFLAYSVARDQLIDEGCIDAEVWTDV